MYLTEHDNGFDVKVTKHEGVNIANLLRVADAIEQHSIAWLGFNMQVFFGDFDKEDDDFYRVRDYSEHNCGTIGCIAGWTRAVLEGYEGDPMNEFGELICDSDWTARPAELLGLNQQQAYSLFCDYPHSQVTPEQAAQALRHVAFTGDTAGCWAHTE